MDVPRYLDIAIEDANRADECAFAAFLQLGVASVTYAAELASEDGEGEASALEQVRAVLKAKLINKSAVSRVLAVGRLAQRCAELQLLNELKQVRSLGVLYSILPLAIKSSDTSLKRMMREGQQLSVADFRLKYASRKGSATSVTRLQKVVSWLQRADLETAAAVQRAADARVASLTTSRKE